MDGAVRFLTVPIKGTFDDSFLSIYCHEHLTGRKYFFLHLFLYFCCHIAKILGNLRKFYTARVNIRIPPEFMW